MSGECMSYDMICGLNAGAVMRECMDGYSVGRRGRLHMSEYDSRTVDVASDFAWSTPLLDRDFRPVA